MLNQLISFGLVLLQDVAASPAYNPTATPQPATENGGFGSFLWLMLGIGIGIVIGLLISKAFGNKQSQAEEKQVTTLDINTPPRIARSATSSAKRCPVCKSTYTDEALIYCVSDGASLVPVNNSPSYEDATRLSPESRHKDLPPTEIYRPNVK